MLINKYNYSTFFYIFIIFHLIIWVAIPSLTNSNLPLDTIEALAWGNDFADPKSDDPISRESSRLKAVAFWGGQSTMDLNWWTKNIYYERNDNFNYENNWKKKIYS